MRFCDWGEFRSGSHHLRAGDSRYKSWSVPGFADPFLYVHYSILHINAQQIRHESKKYNTNAKIPTAVD